MLKAHSKSLPLDQELSVLGDTARPNILVGPPLPYIIAMIMSPLISEALFNT